MTPPAHPDPPFVRWLARPRAVIVDPSAVFLLPRRWPPPNQRALGVSAGGIDLRLDVPAIPATLHRWVRTNLGLWLGECEINYRSRNGKVEVPLRQWIHQHAILLPSPPASADDATTRTRDRATRR
ncbi:hypothetical protein [Nocardia sp. IFM 10818]